MMTDPENDAEQLRPAVPEDKYPARWLYTIPTTAYVRPCRRIAVDGPEQDWADRYSSLTSSLPLAGAEFLRTDAEGEIALVTRLRLVAPWLEPAIAAIDRQLRVQNWAGRPWIAWRPLCLVGPPGCGKSHLARLIGTLAGAGFGVLDLAGTSDNRTLEGTARGWTGAQPCWPAIMMHQTLSANPVLVLEEVDKAGGSHRNGKPLDTLLTMVEAETAGRYYDRCLMAEIDLSHICWMFTCNTSEDLPARLRSRLDIIEVAGPQPEHFEELLRALVSDLAARWGVPLAIMPELAPKACAALRAAFTRTRSVRSLRRQVEALIAALIPAGRKPIH